MWHAKRTSERIRSRLSLLSRVVLLVVAFQVPVRAQPLEFFWQKYQDARGGAHCSGPELAKRLQAYLTKRTKRAIHLNVRDGYNAAEVLTLIDGRKTDFALVSPYSYVWLYEQRPLQMVASYTQQNSWHSSYLVWKKRVAVDRPAIIQRLRDHRDEYIGLVDPFSTSGYIWPRAWLRAKEKADFEKGDVQFRLFGSHTAALAHLFSDEKLQVVATWDVGERIYFANHPEQKALVSEEVITTKIPFDAVVARPDLDSESVAAMRSALLGMHEDPVGKKLLSECFEGWIDSWVAAQGSDYDGVRAFKGTVSRRRMSKEVEAGSDSKGAKEALDRVLGAWFVPVGVDEPGRAFHASIKIVRKQQEYLGTLELKDLATIVGEVRGSTPVRYKGSTLAGVVEQLADALKAKYPLTAFITELDVDPKRGIPISVWSEDGVTVGMPVRIFKRAWLPSTNGISEEKTEIDAYVTDVDDGQKLSFVRAVDDNSNLISDLEPFDRITFSAEIHPFSPAEVPASFEMNALTSRVGESGHLEVQVALSPIDPSRHELAPPRQGWRVDLSVEPPGTLLEGGRKMSVVLKNPEPIQYVWLRIPNPFTSTGLTAEIEGAKSVKKSARFSILSAPGLLLIPFLGGLLAAALRSYRTVTAVRVEQALRALGEIAARKLPWRDWVPWVVASTIRALALGLFGVLSCLVLSVGVALSGKVKMGELDSQVVRFLLAAVPSWFGATALKKLFSSFFSKVAKPASE